MNNLEKRVSLFDFVNFFIVLMIGVVTLYPFLNVLALSLNDSLDTIKGGITIFPREFTFNNYREIFEGEGDLRTGVIISVLRTVIGTVTGILSTAMVAYVISRKDFILRKFVIVLFVVTMYVSGGLIPEFLLIRNLGLTNNFLVYILPHILSAFNIIVMRAFIEGIPFELQESAKIDGANDFTIFLKIIFPLCIPAIATISLFIAVFQWNSWFDTYLYCGSNEMLTTLQYELQKILQNAERSIVDMYNTSNANKEGRISPESIRMAMTIIATAPILIVYPFAQKYFTTGLTLGAVKS